MGFDMPRYNYDYRDRDRYDEDCDRWDDDDDEWYDHDCDDYYDDYSYYSQYSGNRVVTVTADPFGAIYEANRFNNTASQNINYNYYPTDPTYPTPTYPYYPQYPSYPWAY